MLKAGTLIFFSTGWYSDYQILGSFVVLQDLSQKDIDPLMMEVVVEAREYNEESGKIAKQWSKGDKSTPFPQLFNPQQRFIAKMIRAGYLLALTQTEYYLDDSSDGHVKMEIQDA